MRRVQLQLRERGVRVTEDRSREAEEALRRQNAVHFAALRAFCPHLRHRLPDFVCTKFIVPVFLIMFLVFWDIFSCIYDCFEYFQDISGCSGHNPAFRASGSSKSPLPAPTPPPSTTQSPCSRDLLHPDTFDFGLFASTAVFDSFNLICWQKM